MDYRIEERNAFSVVGVHRRVKLQFHGVNPEIAAMWESLESETIDRLTAFNDVEPSGMISASVNFSSTRMEEEGELDHYIGVATTGSAPEGFHRLDVAAGTWAVFPSDGPFPDTLQLSWGRIFSEWFPSSGYELVSGPEILWIGEMTDDPARCFSQIWIPVRRTHDTDA